MSTAGLAQTAGLPQEERKRRVLAVLAAASRLADPQDPLGEEARRVLPAATGLSEAGVNLGLSRHMEREVTGADLSRFLERAGTAPRVHVVLSANVFVGVVRAVALAVAAAPVVRVRASTRESVMAPLLRRALEDGGSGVGFELVESVAPQGGDELHIYGRSETIATIAAGAPSGVVVRGHGPGFGVALVDASADDLDLAAARLSWDVVAFDQRGCLSPRIALVVGSEGVAEALAVRALDELSKREAEVPRGELSEDERQKQSLYRQTLQAVGTCHVGGAFMVGVDPTPVGLMLPPSGRHLHVVRVSSRETAARLLRPFSGAITCVGHASSVALFPELISSVGGARFLPLGGMQCPPLDGPVDLRGMV